MTKVLRPIQRLTAIEINDAPRRLPLVVTLAPDGLYLRRKGRRRSYYLPYQAAYFTAVELAVAEARREAHQEAARPAANLRILRAGGGYPPPMKT